MFAVRVNLRRSACAVISLVVPAVLAGQVPATPVLQNAFFNQGLAFAVNLGSGKGESFYGAAAAWGLGGLGGGRLQVSGAAGASRANDATRGAYGGRVAAALWKTSGGSMGVAAFVGAGGAARTRAEGVITNPALFSIPVGATLGYRRAIGQSRGLSAYVSPVYRWTRMQADSVATSGRVGVSLGFDFAFSSSFGATIGGELAGRSGGSQGGSGTLGLAVSFVPGGR